MPTFVQLPRAPSHEIHRYVIHVQRLKPNVTRIARRISSRSSHNRALRKEFRRRSDARVEMCKKLSRAFPMLDTKKKKKIKDLRLCLVSVS